MITEKQKHQHLFLIQTQNFLLEMKLYKNSSAILPIRFFTSKSLAVLIMIHLFKFFFQIWPLKIVPDESDQFQIEVCWKGETKRLSPEEIVATILQKMKENAEKDHKYELQMLPLQFQAHLTTNKDNQ